MESFDQHLLLAGTPCGPHFLQLPDFLDYRVRCRAMEGMIRGTPSDFNVIRLKIFLRARLSLRRESADPLCSFRRRIFVSCRPSERPPVVKSSVSVRPNASSLCLAVNLAISARGEID